MPNLDRKYDIQKLNEDQIAININGNTVVAAQGETVLSVLNAVGLRRVSRNDSQQTMGSYCGMGVCHCCLVRIDGRYKRRACQTVVQAGMTVETAANRIELEGLQ
ncbi:(2Fe-2S)-binding protein [Chromobacterium haemolyticum]|uniref:(2Fe-2S)-binding protein n=3 Tax=Chromobacterium TaxID=535 RepID=A0ABS3GK89_9NEIS|nr:(2Fe-2S)-binding protein [Chromobacterium rhizoryzae]MBK0413856.1 (2Fe-2S)-binding protein [Chromobacterium haemolyticum]MBO0415457.1 (2Fe-2S)-binding protein [Chromobacterium haemolyticum]MBO0498718.1 (2Fe-2S)-binding protein [Chromobacterium haemolyticum]MDH0340793.1 (2Fe-2S)-binding protein [Chromobacterium haemolyticum]